LSRDETRLWLYFQAAACIDAGCEAIHFGQVEIMNRNDRDLAHWSDAFALVRAYAARHARRHMVLCHGHVPSGGLVRDGRLLLDFLSFPPRIMEVTDRPQEAILKVGFSDGIYGRSKGGLTFSGWTCELLKQGTAEGKRTGKYYAGNFYPLSEVTFAVRALTARPWTPGSRPCPLRRSTVGGGRSHFGQHRHRR